MLDFSQFSALTFDCYGTLIDWESGILTALRPLVRRAGLTLDGESILAAFAREESAQQAATPVPGAAPKPAAVKPAPKPAPRKP